MFIVGFYPVIDGRDQILAVFRVLRGIKKEPKPRSSSDNSSDSGGDITQLQVEPTKFEV
jgi:hypothetical protein